MTLGELIAAYAAATGPLRVDVGDILHGFCCGYLGRDHYACSRVEAVGPDWVVVRGLREPWLNFGSGATIRADLAAHRTPTEDCGCVDVVLVLGD